MTFQLSIKVATDEKIASTTCLINEVKHLFKLIFGHIAAPFFQHYYEQTAKDQYSGIKIEERAQFGQCQLSPFRESLRFSLKRLSLTKSEF